MLSVVDPAPGGPGSSSGASFSKVPRTFPTRKAAAEPQTLWLQRSFILNINGGSLHARGFRRMHLSACKLQMALWLGKASGAFEKWAPGRCHCVVFGQDT